MKHFAVLLVVINLFIQANAQNKNDKYLSVAAFNIQNAGPFGKLAGLFTDQFHPGIEAGYGKNFSSKEHHEWFVQLKVAYFYHRFVQHGVPLYLNVGYRYKISDHFSAETSVGAGYMHSIPATSQLKLNSNGDYVKHKGVGRMQAMAAYSLGLGYIPNPSAPKPVRIFTAYRQQIQMPFVNSYVPFLPYNSFILGIDARIK